MFHLTEKNINIYFTKILYALLKQRKAQVKIRATHEFSMNKIYVKLETKGVTALQREIWKRKSKPTKK